MTHLEYCSKSHVRDWQREAEVPEYLAPAQEQGAIMIGVTGYPGVLPFLFLILPVFITQCRYVDFYVFIFSGLDCFSDVFAID